MAGSRCGFYVLRPAPGMATCLAAGRPGSVNADPATAPSGPARRACPRSLSDDRRCAAGVTGSAPAAAELFERRRDSELAEAISPGRRGGSEGRRISDPSITDLTQGEARQDRTRPFLDADVAVIETNLVKAAGTIDRRRCLRARPTDSIGPEIDPARFLHHGVDRSHGFERIQCYLHRGIRCSNAVGRTEGVPEEGEYRHHGAGEK